MNPTAPTPDARIAALQAENARLAGLLAVQAEALKILLASAVPHPVEHPTMTAAWKVGKDALAATPETVAAFVERVKAEGAVEMMDHLTLRAAAYDELTIVGHMAALTAALRAQHGLKGEKS